MTENTPFYDEGQTYPVDPMMMSLYPIGGFQFWETRSGGDAPTLSVIYGTEHRWSNLCLTKDMAKSLGEAMARWAESQP